MTVVWLIGATTLALAIQTTLAYALGVAAYVNLVVGVVVFFALFGGPGLGLAAGTLTGLAQDVLSGSLLGVNGFANSLVGVVTGFAGQQFIVASFVTRAVVFVLGSVLQGFCVIGLYSLIEGRGLRLVPGVLVSQALVNAVVGSMAFAMLESFPEAAKRRRSRGLVR